MTDPELENVRVELLRKYPNAKIKVAPDGAEVVAEITAERAVAVIERSQAHFHREMTEIYTALRGTLYVACEGKGYVLNPGESITVKPGCIHYARGAFGVAWVEVICDPGWRQDDHFVL